MPAVGQTLRQGREHALAWLARSYDIDMPLVGNVGESLSGAFPYLRDPDLARAAGVTDEAVLSRIRQRANRMPGSNPLDMDVPGVASGVRSGSTKGLFDALGKSHTGRIKMGLFGGAAIGALVGAFDPDSSVLGNALLYGAEGFAFETFMPTMGYLYLGAAAIGIASGVAGNVSRASNERLHHVMSGRGLYSQHDPSQNQFAGNIRRQSLGYMMQSKQNTRSFVGSEATYFHATS